MTEVLSFSQPPTDLPLEVTTFVGRQVDQSRIRELMPASRLVTLTGFGGIGKTRLALRMAADLQRVYDDVYVVALAGLTDPDDVPDQIAASLGLHGRSRQSATIAAVEYLRSRTALLVLDNCEHVIEVAAVVADTLLRTCPGVHLLATSREPLRIPGEVTYPVAPLTAPDGASDTQPLEQYDAVRLFVDRARAIIPDFALTPENRAAVAAVSRKLDGIPLAIELATARLRAFTPSELDAHLTDRWEVLGRGSRTAPLRHSTMAACIEWSFDLCTPAERQLWARASVFVDGFDLDAAVAVCSVSGEEPIHETLASLVEKSILTATPHQAANRYRMLPPIRHRGRLELTRSGQDAELRRRHKEFFLAFAANAHAEWFGPRQLACLTRLRRERGNLSKAFQTCTTEPGYADGGLQAGADLFEFGLIEGRFQQGGRWFDEVLAGPPGDVTIRARALRTAASWAAMQGDADRAARLLDERRSLPPLDRETDALLTQAEGLVAVFAGEPERAEPLLREASLSFVAAGNDAELALCTILLALDHLMLGELDSVLDDHRACLAVTEPVGETWLRSWSLWTAGLALWARSEADAARELVAQSLRLKRLVAEPLGIAVLLDTVAWFASADDPGRAAILLGAAANQWDRVDTPTDFLPGARTPRRAASDTARVLLGEEAFEHARGQGRSMDESTAIALALDEHPLPAAGDTSAATVGGSLSPLTRREREIAALIHRGLSNKAIAEALVISPRTAETHVENILTKLGFTSRTQVAAWVADQSRPADH